MWVYLDEYNIDFSQELLRIERKWVPAVVSNLAETRNVDSKLSAELTAKSTKHAAWSNQMGDLLPFANTAQKNRWSTLQLTSAKSVTTLRYKRKPRRR